MSFTAKNLSALHAVLMKETQISRILDCRMSSPNRKTGFAPIQVQTGAGKTRAALRTSLYRAAQNIADPDSARKVFYTTPRVENIKMELAGLRKHIRGLRADKVINATQEKLLHNSVIILPSRKDILSDLIVWRKDNASGLSRQCLKPSPRKKSPREDDLTFLYKIITGKKTAPSMARLNKSLEALAYKSKDKNNITDEEIGRIFSILDEIFLPQTEDIAETAANIVKVNAPEARMLFPRLFVTDPNGAQIVLMSTKRLLLPIGAAVKGESLTLMNGAGKKPSIIFLDEGDAAFSEMLAHAFDDLDKNEVDIASVVQGFAKLSVRYAFFEEEVLDQKLKKLVTVSQEICDTHKFDAPLRIAPELREKLKGSFPQSLGDANIWEYSTVIAEVRHDPRFGTALVRLEDKHSGLNRFFNEVRDDFDRKFSSALLSLVKSVQEFLRQNAETQVEKTRVTQKTALAYILEQLRMDPASRNERESVLINVLDTRMQNIMIYEKRGIGVPLSVHDLGLRYAKVWRTQDEWSHVPDASYKIYALAAAKTPNNMLATLAKEHLVIGLSATMYSPSVTRNFDYGYLERCLGEHLIKMSPSEIEALHAEYVLMRRYDEAISAGEMNVERLEIDEIMDAEMRDIMLTAFVGLVREDSSVMSEQDLNAFSKVLNDKESAGHHEVARIMRVLNAIRAFLRRTPSPETDGVRMMAFLGAGLKGWGMSWVRWPAPEALIKAVAKEMGRRNGKVPSVQDILTEDLRTLKEKEWEASPDAPLIILTTYATAGAGFNLQQKISEPLDHLINIGKVGLRSDSVDFDAIYLDKSSYPILKGDAFSPSGKIKNAYAVQSMAEARIFSDSDMRSILKNIVRAEEGSLKNIMSEVNKTIEARHVFMAEIIQALGRLSRTGLRRRRILHMVSHELMSFLSGSASDYDKNKVSWEFHQLATWARGKRPALRDKRTTTDLFGKTDDDPTVMHSQSGSVIRKTLKGLWGENPAPYISQWKRYRTSTRVEPTIEKAQVDQWLYMNDRDMSARAVLFASQADMTLMETNAIFSLRETSDAKFKQESSEQAARLDLLMKSPVVKSYFKEIGCATFWEPKGQLITPVICQSIYAGEIGEQAIRALLRERDIGVHQMPDGEFEIFDMVAGHVPLDAKNYKGGFSSLVHAHRENMIQNAVRKAVRIKRDKVLLVSVFGTADGTISRETRDGVTIVLIDGIMKNSGETLHDSLSLIKEESSKA